MPTDTGRSGRRAPAGMRHRARGRAWRIGWRDQWTNSDWSARSQRLSLPQLDDHERLQEIVMLLRTAVCLLGHALDRRCPIHATSQRVAVENDPIDQIKQRPAHPAVEAVIVAVSVHVQSPKY